MCRQVSNASDPYPAIEHRSVRREVRCGARRAHNGASSFDVTWGADEHFLIAAAGLFWLSSRGSSEERRAASVHLLAVSVLSSRLPKLIKRGFNQVRPDRLTAIGHGRGVPFSGHAQDAFPSGHAVHMGALASAACNFPPNLKAVAWAAAIGLSLTRIAILAHWTSDVAAGFAGGFLSERIVRRWTGYPGIRSRKSVR